jgi:hypothetical protein
MLFLLCCSFSPHLPGFQTPWVPVYDASRRALWPGCVTAIADSVSSAQRIRIGKLDTLVEGLGLETLDEGSRLETLDEEKEPDVSAVLENGG